MPPLVLLGTFCPTVGSDRQPAMTLQGTVAMQQEWEPEDLVAAWTLVEPDWALLG